MYKFHVVFQTDNFMFCVLAYLGLPPEPTFWSYNSVLTLVPV